MSERRAASIRRLATLLDWQRRTELIDASYPNLRSWKEVFAILREAVRIGSRGWPVREGELSM